MMRNALKMVAVLLAAVLLLAACNSDSSSDDTSSDDTSEAPDDSDSDSTDSTDAATSTTMGGGEALTDNGDGSFDVDWASVSSPFFDFEESDDPFWHIHSDLADDGVFLSLEMYTVYGPTWTGETGEFEINCDETSTGICIHFDVGEGDVGADFSGTGTITINQLDDSGYDLVVSDVAFGDGTTIPGPVELKG